MVRFEVRKTTLEGQGEPGGTGAFDLEEVEQSQGLLGTMQTMKIRTRVLVGLGVVEAGGVTSSAAEETCPEGKGVSNCNEQQCVSENDLRVHTVKVGALLVTTYKFRKKTLG